MFIDTHCHLTDNYVPESEIPGILERAKNAGVGGMIVVSADPDDPQKVIKLCEKYDNLYCTVGLHPHHAGKATPNYEHLLSHSRVLAIGEIGLDYYYGAENRMAQIELFRAQMEIANKHGMSVAIHSRDAADDVSEILCDPAYSNIGGTGAPGVMHCVYTNWDLTKKMLARGFYISTSGTLTFKNKDEARDIFRMLPIDRIVIETDAPYLAPEPYRSKKCEPFMIIETAKVLAEIKNLQLGELEIILEENTKKLYPKWHGKL